MTDRVHTNGAALVDLDQLSEWVVQQRWYASKSRSVSAIELVENRSAQGRPLFGISSSAQLVKENERALGRLDEDLRDPAHMRRERRE